MLKTNKLHKSSSHRERIGSDLRFPGALVSALVTKRMIWLPTIRGWLALLILLLVAAILLGRNLHYFLALNEPVDARALVVEGWMEPEELDQVNAIFRAGNYDLVVTTGGPIDRWPVYDRHATYADLAADYLKNHGLENAAVTAAPSPRSPQDRTFVSAVMVRNWAARSGRSLDALDVVSAGAHARRSRLLYRLAFGPGVPVGVLAATPADYDAETWWRTSFGAKTVLVEAIGLAWVKCCFWPSPPDSGG